MWIVRWYVLWLAQNRAHGSQVSHAKGRSRGLHRSAWCYCKLHDLVKRFGGQSFSYHQSLWTDPSEYTTKWTCSGTAKPGHGWVREENSPERRSRSTGPKGAEISQYTSAILNNSWGKSMDPALALCRSSWLLEPMNCDITSAGIGMGFWNSTNLSLYQEAQLTIHKVWLSLCLFVTWNITIPYYKGGVGGNPHGESFFIIVNLVLKNRTNSEVRRLWSKLTTARFICFPCLGIPRAYLSK